MNKEYQRFKNLAEGNKVIQNDRDAVFLLSFPIGAEEEMENISSLVSVAGCFDLIVFQRFVSKSCIHSQERRHCEQHL
jgi:hypothetical protein